MAASRAAWRDALRASACATASHIDQASWRDIETVSLSLSLSHLKRPLLLRRDGRVEMVDEEAEAIASFSKLFLLRFAIFQNCVMK